MPVQTTCPACSAKLKVPDELIGKTVKCPKCGEHIAIPTNAIVAASVVPAALPYDPLGTTDHNPSAAMPMCTVAFGAGSPSADVATGAYVPGHDTEPADTEPKHAAASVSVPGYEIEAVLGRGGMGVVYKARHLTLKRTVALKMVLAGGHAGPDDLARFRSEAEAVARLQHPNIVQIYEVNEAGGHPYFSLEFVDGGTLAARLDGAPQAPEDAARLMQTLADAVQFAHEHGIVHRDLKPGNILLAKPSARGSDSGSPSTVTSSKNSHRSGVTTASALGTPKIADFGLAKNIDAPSSGQTASGSILGTPSYMAPEQAAGKVHDIGPAADVYALGAILYEMLTGRPPFRGATMLDTLQQVRSQEPVPPSTLQPSVPRDLETICLKCLQKEQAKRYASADGLAEELGRYLVGEPILARPVGPAERAWRWCRRNPVIAALTAAVVLAAAAFVLALAVGLAGVSWKWLEAEKSERDAVQARKDAEAEQKKAVAARDDAESQRKKAVSARDDAETERKKAEKSEEKATKALNDSLRQTVGILLDKGSDLAERGEISQGLLWMLESLKVSQDVKDSALERVIRANLASWQGETHALKHIHDHEYQVRCCLYHPDGKRVVIGRHGVEPEDRKPQEATFQVWDREGGKLLLETVKLGSQHLHAMAFSPDGKMLVTLGHNPDRLKRWSMDTGKEIGPAIVLPGVANDVAFSPDGQLLASAGEDGTVRLWESGTAKPVREIPHDRASVRSAAFSPDSQALLTTTDEGRNHGALHCWEAATGKRIGEPQQLTAPPTHRGCSFAVDGKSVLTLAGREAQWWDFFLPQGVRRAGPPLRLNQPIHLARFAPDGQMVLLGHGDSGWYSAHLNHRLARTLPNHMDNAAFSPDGLALVTPSGSHSLLWELARSPYRPVPIHFNRVLEDGVIGGGIAYSPDRQSVLMASGKTVSLMDVASGRFLGPPLKHKWNVGLVAFSPDGSRVASSSHDKGFSDGGSLGTQCQLCDAKTGRPVCPPLPHINWVNAMDFSPDGKIFATGAFDGCVHLWDAATGKRLGPPLIQPSIVTALAFSPDGKTLAVGHSSENSPYGNGLIHWNVADRKKLRVLKQGLGKIQFRPDGKLVGTAYGHSQQWDLETGEKIGPGYTSGNNDTPVFSADSRWMLTVAADGRAHVRDTATRTAAGLGLPHPGTISAFAMSSDGQFILLAGNGSTRLWDRATLKPIGPPILQPTQVHAVAFAPDGRSFVTTCADGATRAWPVPQPVQGDPARLAMRLHVRTGLSMDKEKTILPLDYKKWAEKRQELVKEEGSADGAYESLLDVQAWHDARVRDAEQDHDLFAGIFHLDRMIAHEPKNWMLHARRARFHTNAEQFDKAQADYERAAKLAGAEQLDDWFRHRAYQCEAFAQWTAAIWYLDKVIAEAPKEWQWYETRALAHGKLDHVKEHDADLDRAIALSGDGHLALRVAEEYALRELWAKAANNYLLAATKGPQTPAVWQHHALVRAQLKDDASYRVICQALSKAGGGAAPPRDLAEAAVAVCILRPKAVADFKSTITLAERLLAQTAAADKNRKRLDLSILGAVLCRAGRHKDAVDRLKEALALSAEIGQKDHDPHNWLFLALAYHHLGDAPQAREWLDKAIKHPLPAPGKRSWADLEIDLLRREIESLIAVKSAKPQT